MKSIYFIKFFQAKHQKTINRESFNVVAKYTTFFYETSNINNVLIDNEVTISGILHRRDDTPLKNVEVTLLVNHVKYKVKTNLYGEFELSFVTNKLGENRIIATYNGNAKHEQTTYTFKFNVVEKYSTKINIYPKYDVHINDEIYISGVISSSEYVSYLPIVITVNDVEYTESTNEYGQFYLLYFPNNVGEYNITVIFDGNDMFYSSTESSKFYVEE